jgi:hypothetical protein
LLRLLTDQDIFSSMSRSGNVWDNAAVGSVFSSHKTERVSRKNHRTRYEARTDLFDYIESFYDSFELIWTSVMLSCFINEAMHGRFLRHKSRSKSWPEIDRVLKRGLAVFSCLFFLFSGLLLAEVSIEVSAPNHVGASIGTAPNGDMPEGANSDEQQCHGSLGCSLVLPTSPLAIIALTRANTIDLEDVYRGIGRSPGLRPPRPSFFA